MITRKWVRIVSALFAVAASTSVAATARASNIASSMWNCTSGNISMTSAIDIASPGNGNFGQVSIDSTKSIATYLFICPAQNISSISSATLSLDAYKQASNSVQVRACVTYVGGFGGNCSPWDTNSSTGIVTIQPSTAVWTSNPTSYRWFEVSVNRPASGSNTVFGYRQD